MNPRDDRDERDEGRQRRLPVIGPGLDRADVAPEAGYDEDGPEPLPGDVLGKSERYEGPVPVFQWDVDPNDPSIEWGEAHVVDGDWEYDVWWQRHPAELVYGAIQAMREDPEHGPGRRHPLGRNVVVNIVWDERRRGIVAIYGTARDFRPFVTAFCKGMGMGLESQDAKDAKERT